MMIQWNNISRLYLIYNDELKFLYYKDTNLIKFFIDRNYSFVKEIECDKIFLKN